MARTPPRPVPAPDPADNEPLISKSGVAQHLGVHTRTVERMLARGELPKPIRVGRQLRWRPCVIREHFGRLEEKS